MNIPVYIIDDEFHAIDILKDYIHQTPGLVLSGSATDPFIALDTLATGIPPQLIFIDIHMPRLSGIEIAKILHGRTCIIFTTSFRDHGPEAYDLDIADYLLKPFSYERFLKSVIRARGMITQHQKMPPAPPESFFFKTDIKGKYTRIFLDSISFIESDRNYGIIHHNGEQVKVYLTLKEITEKLPPESFCRTHGSFIVNLLQIKTMEHGQLHLADQTVIPIGREFRQELLRRLNVTLLISSRDQ